MFLDGCAQIPIGAESVGVGADDLEDLEEDEKDYFQLGKADTEFHDYGKLGLKPDHASR